MTASALNTNKINVAYGKYCTVQFRMFLYEFITVYNILNMV